MLERSLLNYYIVNHCFPSGNITLNVVHFFQIFIMCMFQLKCCEKQDELTHNVVYLSFIGESQYVEVKTRKF